MNNPLASFSHCSLPRSFVGQTTKKRSRNSLATSPQVVLSQSIKQAIDQHHKDRISAKELSDILLKQFKSIQNEIEHNTIENSAKKRKLEDDNTSVKKFPMDQKIDFESLVKSSLRSVQYKDQLTSVSSPIGCHDNSSPCSVSNSNSPTFHSASKTQKKSNKPSIIKEFQNGVAVYKINGMKIDFKVPTKSAKSTAFEQTWKIHYEQLVEFKKRYGHTNVTRCSEGYEELGGWVSEQRRKLKNGKVTLEQFETLNELDFEWDRSYYFHNTYKPNEDSEIQKTDKNLLPEAQPSNSHMGAEALMVLSEASTTRLPPISSIIK